MSQLMRQTRENLCDLLDGLTDEQWDAETLCEGWTCADMAAHLISRERDVWASPGILIGPLSGLHERQIRRRRTESRDTLVAQLRTPPPWIAGPVAGVQVGEDWIHTEDIRRGGAAALPGTVDLTPDDGTGSPELQRALLGSMGRFTVLVLGGLDVSGTVTFDMGAHTRHYAVGGKLVRPGEGDTRRRLTVSAPVGDALLWLLGRTAAVSVDLDGDADLLAAITGKDRAV